MAPTSSLTTFRPTELQGDSAADPSSESRNGLRSATRLAIHGSELLFAEVLAVILARREHFALTCPTSVERLVAEVAAGRADICVVDVSGSADADAIRAVRAVAPMLPIVVVAHDSNPSLLDQALDADPDGLCVRTDGIDEIERVILEVRNPGATSGRRPLLSRGSTKAVKGRSDRSRSDYLTPKEQAVLALLTSGTSTSDIARALEVSEATVRTHLQHLFAKFGVHSRVALTAAAVRANGGNEIGSGSPR